MIKKTAFVIGTGPSLRKIDMSKLKDKKTVTFNRAYIAFDDWGFDPTYYLSIDSNDLRSMYKDVNKLIENSQIEKFFLAACEDNATHPESHWYQDQEKVESHYGMFTNSEKVYWIEKGPQKIQDCKIHHDPRTFSSHHHPNAGWMGIKLLYALGYNEIAFVGFDSRYKDDEESNQYITKIGRGYTSHADYDVNHFRDDYFGKGMTFGKPNMDQIISIWTSGKEEIETMSDLEVYSCTENSTLNGVYKYIKFEDFINGVR